MAKTMSMKVVESNLDKLKAYALAKNSDSESAKKCVGVQFNLQDYVITHNTIVDNDTGESVEMDCLTIRTTDNHLIGTNSKTLISNLEDILELCADEDMSISELPLIIKQGEGTNGTFNTIEIVL